MLSLARSLAQLRPGFRKGVVDLDLLERFACLDLRTQRRLADAIRSKPAQILDYLAVLRMGTQLAPLPPPYLS